MDLKRMYGEFPFMMKRLENELTEACSLYMYPINDPLRKKNGGVY